MTNNKLSRVLALSWIAMAGFNSQSFASEISIVAPALSPAEPGYSEPIPHPVRDMRGVSAVSKDVILRLSSKGERLCTGGIVAIDDKLTLEVQSNYPGMPSPLSASSEWALNQIVAIKDLDVFVSSFPNFNSGALTINTLVLSNAAHQVKIWTTDPFTVRIGQVSVEANTHRDSILQIPATDIESPIPTQTIGDKTYTLRALYVIE